jgi:hypothetical protein
MKKDKNDLQVFRLSKQVIEASGTSDQVDNTFDDMVEAGVAYPPFDKFAIEVSAEALDVFLDKFLKVDPREELVNPDDWKQVKSFFMEYEINVDQKVFGKDTYWADGFAFLHSGVSRKFSEIGSPNPEENKAVRRYTHKMLGTFFQFLIVLLATKNIEKTTKFHKDISNGKVSKATKHRKKYPYTTTLTIGKITENYNGSKFTGVSRRPHLRRGHVRTQHYGPRNELTKKIFVPSVFVNGSEDIKSNRVAYNVSFAA